MIFLFLWLIDHYFRIFYNKEIIPFIAEASKLQWLVMVNVYNLRFLYILILIYIVFLYLLTENVYLMKCGVVWSLDLWTKIKDDLFIVIKSDRVYFWWRYIMWHYFRMRRNICNKCWVITKMTRGKIWPCSSKSRPGAQRRVRGEVAWWGHSHRDPETRRQCGQGQGQAIIWCHLLSAETAEMMTNYHPTWLIVSQHFVTEKRKIYDFNPCFLFH